jgi:hypothetical protein
MKGFTMARHIGWIMAALFFAQLARAETPPAFPVLVDQSNLDAPVADGCTGCAPAQTGELQLGYRSWFSWGSAEDLAFGNSLFQFRDTYSTVHEFNIDAVWNRLVSRVDLGFGGVDHGYFQIEDPASGPRFPLDGNDLFYVSGDVGFRLLQCGDPCRGGGALDLLVGYQHWRETYFENDPANPEGPAFTDTFYWDSVRIGGRGQLRRERWQAQARFLVSPYTHFANHTSSATLAADGGWGLWSDVSVSYRLWKNLAVELGYQVFFLESASGTIDIGTGPTPDFQGAEHVRHGILLGVNWRF